MLFSNPTQQSPKAYDLANLSADQIAARLGAGTSLTRATNVLASIRDSGYQYKIHPAETADGLTDADLTFGFDVADPRRYGADPTGAADSTAAVQTAFNVAKLGNCAVSIGKDCNFLTGAVSITLASSTGTTGLRVEGSSQGGSRLTLNGAPAALLSILGPTPGGNPAQSQFVMENLSLIGNSAAVTGLLLEGIGWFQLRNVFITGFGNNLKLSSALAGTMIGGALSAGTTGAYIRPYSASGAACNLLRFKDVIINANTSWGIDFDGLNGGPGCALLSLEGCDIERNGTATNYSTGGLRVGQYVSQGLGYSLVRVTGCWFELNNGQTIQIDQQAGGYLFAAFRDTLTLSEDAGHAINAPGLFRLGIDNCWSPSAGATWTLSANSVKISNALTAVLADTSTNKIYEHFNVGGSNVYSPQIVAPFTDQGTTASTASGAPVTAVTLPADAFASYLVSATIGSGGASAYSAVAIVSTAGGAAAELAALQSPTHLTISVSGFDVQLTQTSGGASAMDYSVMRIA